MKTLHFSRSCVLVVLAFFLPLVASASVLTDRQAEVETASRAYAAEAKRLDQAVIAQAAEITALKQQLAAEQAARVKAEAERDAAVKAKADAVAATEALLSKLKGTP